MRRSFAGLLVVALAAGLALLPFEPGLVESLFSTAIYPRVQRAVTPVTNTVPFALLDPLILAVAVLCIVLLVRAVRRCRATRSVVPLGAAVWQLVVAACALYLAFLFLWGFNYRRLPMDRRIDLQTGRPETQEVSTLGQRAVGELNRLHDDAHATGWTTEEWRHQPLRDAFTATQQHLTGAPATMPGRLKQTLLGQFFRWSSVDGMVNPFGLEVLENPDLLPWERPFVAAHEWAHLAGFAHEAEASFVGWLACMRADAPARYSGWLFVYWQLAGELPAAQGAALAASLAAGPRSDIDAIVDRLRRGQFPLLRRVSWRVYDSYLKANRVEQGVASYGEALTLILQARLDDEGRPVRRLSPPGP